ncbi:MAG: hypothetical protein ACRETW_06845 [Stenotrophobium sp.]
MLNLKEFHIGAVAYFNFDRPNGDADIAPTTASTPARDRPHVLVQRCGGRSVWSPLTCRQRIGGERLFIERRWRRGGSDTFSLCDLFLQDGRNTFIGADRVFARASAPEFGFFSHPRPSITRDGVRAIVAEIAYRGGTLLAGTEPGSSAALSHSAARAEFLRSRD